MKVADFRYTLPERLIASHPIPERTESRLMIIDPINRSLIHKRFYNLIDYLNEKDLLVFNDTRVIPARLYGKKSTGGKVELLVEKILSSTKILCHLKVNKKIKIGTVIYIGQNYELVLENRNEELFELKLTLGTIDLLLKDHGHIPLPPYIKRDDNIADIERYQTVYAKQPGAVAAPTAGLHFDEKLIQKIKNKGIRTESLTLHVGAGTFQSIRATDINEHKMHQESISVSKEIASAIEETRAKGGRVIAVGTTVVRALESVALNYKSIEQFDGYQGETKIFIYPGFNFKWVDAIVTNFHLPESTLLMLVSAFAGKEFIAKAYNEAVENEYRFFSYGDAMFINMQDKKDMVE